MSLTELVIIFLICLALFYVIYEECIIRFLRGKTQLKIYLKRQHILDSSLLLLLIVIFACRYGHQNSSRNTIILLTTLVLACFYIFVIRRAKLRFKNGGFYYSIFWIDYSRITSINLSYNGVLTIQLGSHNLSIQVKKADDLEKIYQVMVAS